MPVFTLPKFADVAMGTRLLALGFTAPLEALNISNAKLIQNLHQDDLDAGAQILTTHSFGINPWRYSQLDVIPFAVQNALAAISNHGSRLVLGNIGPSGLKSESRSGEWKSGFAKVCAIFAKTDVSGLLLETFTQFSELQVAGTCAVESGLPVVASVTPQNQNQLFDGTPLGHVIEFLQNLGVSAIGINCVDPKLMNSILNAIKPLTRLPILAKPNAGLPQRIDGRLVYPLSASEFARDASQLFEAGASCVGGCCGTTSESLTMLTQN